MPPVLWHVERHHDEVPDTDTDFLLAAGAQIRLARLERMDERDFEIVAVASYPSAAHSTRTMTTTNAAITST